MAPKTDKVKKSVDGATLEELIHAAVLVPLDDPSNNFCRWGLPIVLWGLPGVGKSERIIIGSLKAGLATKQVYAPRFMPDDVTGVAVADGKGDTKTAITITAVKELKEMEAGVFFIDELSSCKDAVQAAFLGVILDRDIAGERLPGRVRILAAANPPEVAANGRELTSALSNRLCHIRVEPPNAREWAEWMMNGDQTQVLQVEQGEQVIKENWDYEWGRAKAIFSEGIKRNPDLLHKLPSDESGKRGEAWPSPRTWEFAARAWATCKCLNYGRQVSDTLIEGCVGEAAATTMLKWISDQDLPDPADVLRGGFKPDPMRMDRAFLIYNSITQYVINQKEREEQLKLAYELWRTFQAAVDAGMLDVIADCIKLTVNKRLGMSSNAKIAEVARPIIERIGDGLMGLV